jgi:5-methylcytosine-specific restriction endonuclease McrA
MNTCSVKDCSNSSNALGFCAKHYQRFKKYKTPTPEASTGFRERSKNLIGKTFGRLVVIEDSKNRSKRGEILWRCICACGTVCDIVGCSLTRGFSNSCGCLRKELGAQRKPICGFPATYNHVYIAYKRHARLKKRSFELSLATFVQIAKKDCYYCGQPPKNALKSKCGRENFIYNGLDRINNDNGYTLDNVVACCFKCNLAKKKMSQKDFLSWVTQLANNLRLRFING